MSPRRPPPPCRQPGCPGIQPCPAHPAPSHGWGSSRRQDHRSGSGWAEARAAKRVLARDGHRCQIQGPGCVGHATECDHVIPLSVTGPAGDHDANKQAACTVCHKAKTEAEKQAAMARRPPRRRPVERHPGFVDPGGGVE